MMKIRNKSIACFFIIILLVGTFSGCRLIDDIADDLENSQSAVGGKNGLEIIRCLNEHDSEALKELFCELMKRTHDLDSEIENAFGVFDTPITKFDPILVGGEKKNRDGVIIYNYASSSIHNVVSGEKTYTIFLSTYIVNENKNLVGVTCIDIYNADDELICSIGEQV